MHELDDIHACAGERLTQCRSAEPVHRDGDGHHGVVEVAENVPLGAPQGFCANMPHDVGNDVDGASVDATDYYDLLTEKELGRLHGVAVDTDSSSPESILGLSADDYFLTLVANNRRVRSTCLDVHHVDDTVTNND
jgi:hypothetical protein